MTDALKPTLDPTERNPSPFPLTATDLFNLSQTDDHFKPHSWEELKQIIAENRLEVLKRWPSDLRRYQKWATDVKSEYGSVQSYVMKNRLRWAPSTASTALTGPLFDYNSPVPFYDEDDYKILPNDWPYGLEPGIKHLIVWVKNRLESEPVRGDMTPKVRLQVEDFVQHKFVDRVRGLPGHAEKVMWFKNWGALQSVPGMDHIHVLVRDVPQNILDEWTEGVKPLQVAPKAT